MQNGKPIVPLLYFAQKSLIKSLGELFVKTDMFERCKTPSSLRSLDLPVGKTSRLPKNFELGFGMRDHISKLKTKDVVSKREMIAFKKVAHFVIITMVNILFD